MARRSSGKGEEERRDGEGGSSGGAGRNGRRRWDGEGAAVRSGVGMAGGAHRDGRRRGDGEEGGGGATEKFGSVTVGVGNLLRVVALPGAKCCLYSNTQLSRVVAQPGTDSTKLSRVVAVPGTDSQPNCPGWWLSPG